MIEAAKFVCIPSQENIVRKAMEWKEERRERAREGETVHVMFIQTMLTRQGSQDVASSIRIIFSDSNSRYQKIQT